MAATILEWKPFLMVRRRKEGEKVKWTYRSGPQTKTRMFFFLISSSPLLDRPFVQRLLTQDVHDQCPLEIPSACAMEHLSILPTWRERAMLSGTRAWVSLSTNSLTRRWSGCAPAKSIRGCKIGEGGSSAGLRDVCRRVKRVPSSTGLSRRGRRWRNNS